MFLSKIESTYAKNAFPIGVKFAKFLDIRPCWPRRLGTLPPRLLRFYVTHSYFI